MLNRDTIMDVLLTNYEEKDDKEDFERKSIELFNNKSMKEFYQIQTEQLNNAFKT